MAASKPVYRLEIGDEAPDFRLKATGDGAGKGGSPKEISLAEFRGRKNVVLAFFPAAFTPV
jgi:peroxiredoxin